MQQTNVAPKQVKIVVMPREDLQDRCKGSQFHPTDILIPEDSWSDEPFHCPNDLHELVAHGPHLEAHAHGDVHMKFPDTLLTLSFTGGESVRWSCDTHDFKIIGVTIRGNDYGRVPNNPFAGLDLDRAPGREALSGTISKEAINHQFKIHIAIQQMLNGTVRQRIIDPDVWCSF